MPYALIGGLAVAHYGECYLTAAQKTAHGFPIYSKDIDFRGGSDLFQAIQREADAAGMTLVGGLGVIKPKPRSQSGAWPCPGRLPGW